VRFETSPLTDDLALVGPAALRLWVSCSPDDLDVFATLRVLAAEGDDAVPISRGWLRASPRRLDPARSTPYRLFHSHDRVDRLVPDQLVPLDIGLNPLGCVIGAEHRLALDIEAHHGGGVFPGLHDDPDDRDPERLAGVNTLHTGVDQAAHLVLPVLPR
jgi:predicted acyl esterase